MDDSLKLSKVIYNLILDKKPLDIEVIDIRSISTLSDYLIIATSNSSTQTKAIIAHITKSLKKIKIKPLNIEGYTGLNWILMDYSSLVVHIFSKEAKQYYQFHRLWEDCSKINFKKNEDKS